MKTAIWCYFPLSAGISPHGRYQPHGQWRHLEVDATGRDRVYGWLSVGYHVSGVSRPGRVGHSDPQRPSTGSIWRPISRTNWGSFFCPLRLDRAVGVNPRSSLRYGMCLVVVVRGTASGQWHLYLFHSPQHQTPSACKRPCVWSMKHETSTKPQTPSKRPKALGTWYLAAVIYMCLSIYYIDILSTYIQQGGPRKKK